jgi:putative ATP-binding cassette transporter
VLLDEATSALDEVAEASMMQLFEDELKGAAVLSIGHRPGLAQWHDRVLRMDGGRLLGTGLPPLPAPGRVRIAHAHAAPDLRPVLRSDRLRSPGPGLGQPAR